MSDAPPSYLLFTLLIFLLSAAAAQTGSSIGSASKPIPPSDRTLIAVHVTGSKRFTSEQVAAASGLQVGTSVNGDEDFRKAARQLGQSGAFTDVSYSYSYSSAGTRLEWKVTDTNSFLPAHFEDFVWFSDRQLQQKVHEHIPLFEGELPSSGRLPDQVSDVLQALLVELGVPGHVEYARTADKSGKLASFDYSVSGVLIRIRNIDFPGAAADDLPQLQSAAEKLDRVYSRDHLSAFVEHSLLPLYRERGYLQASFASPLTTIVKEAPSSDAGVEPRNLTTVDVALTVTPGSQYKLSALELAGNKEIPAEVLRPLIRAKPGQTANTVQLADDLKQIQTLYSSRGYVTATAKTDLQFDDPAGTVSYRIDIREGPVYHMGDLEFRGLDNGLIARLRAAWKLRPGDVYDASYLDQYLPQARKLLPSRLDWEVSAHATANTRDKTVDVDLVYTVKAAQ
jgi:outer membrane protein insertion porin family